MRKWNLSAERMAGRERKNDAAQNSLHTIQIQGTQTLFSFKKYIKNSKKYKKKKETRNPSYLF